MSKVITLTGANNANNVQVQQRVGVLKVHYRTPDANVADWPTLLARMNNVKLEVNLQSKDGRTENLVPNVGLGALAEMFSINESYVHVSDNGIDHDVQFGIEVSSDGALFLDAQSGLVIKTEGMQANDALDIYAMDFPVTSVEANKVNVLRLEANVAKVFGLSNGSQLHLPISSFQKIELTFKNGQVITLEGKEIEQWVLEGNELAGVLVNAPKYGFIAYYSINTTDMVSAKITHTADVNAYMFTKVRA